jgi:hypothetical protein
MPERRFLKGDRVQFRFGIRSVQGEVKEDRGPIGIKGRHLYLVEFRVGPESIDISQVELPAEDMQLVQDTAATE